jgi:hypothetical protein
VELGPTEQSQELRDLTSPKGFLKLMGEEVMDFSLLSKVDSPADIKKLDRQQLGQLRMNCAAS